MSLRTAERVDVYCDGLVCLLRLTSRMAAAHSKLLSYLYLGTRWSSRLMQRSRHSFSLTLSTEDRSSLSVSASFVSSIPKAKILGLVRKLETDL